MRKSDTGGKKFLHLSQLAVRLGKRGAAQGLPRLAIGNPRALCGKGVWEEVGSQGLGTRNQALLKRKIGNRCAYFLALPHFSGKFATSPAIPPSCVFTSSRPHLPKMTCCRAVPIQMDCLD